jgi:hypothetical protein
MTVIAAYIKDNVVWVGSDSLGSTDYIKCSFGSKIVVVNTYLVAFAASYRVADLIKECNDFPKEITCVTDARAFRDKLRSLMIEDGAQDRASEHSTIQHPVNIIVASSSGIYVIENDYQLHRLYGERSYYALGSGLMVAHGALYTAAQLNLDGKTAVHMAISSAITHTPGCGGTPYLGSVNLCEEGENNESF